MNNVNNHINNSLKRIHLPFCAVLRSTLAADVHVQQDIFMPKSEESQDIMRWCKITHASMQLKAQQVNVICDWFTLVILQAQACGKIGNSYEPSGKPLATLQIARLTLAVRGKLARLKTTPNNKPFYMYALKHNVTYTQLT